MLRLSVAAALLAPKASAGPPAAPGARSLARRQDQALPLLVEAGWLNERISAGDPTLVILDLGDRGDYRDGHVPGGLHSYWQETIERDYPVYGTVLNQMDVDVEVENQGRRIAWLRRYGIGAGSRVIAYDHGDGRRAARIVWFLRFLGHPDAAALDGGISAWNDAGFETTTSSADPKTLTDAPVVNPASGFYVATTQLQGALNEPNTMLIDIRSESERRDTVDQQFDLGVIPGSIWLPWTDFVADDAGRFIESGDALAKLAAANVVPERRVILYGRFGSDADQMWLLLKSLGFPSVEIYDRGWVEWSTTPGLSADPLP